MPCGSHWCRHWWSTMSEGPDLGGSDCGQQVPRALSVCIITHFLHQVICLGTRGKRHTRVDSSRVIIHQRTFWVWSPSDIWGLCCQRSKYRKTSAFLLCSNSKKTSCIEGWGTQETASCYTLSDCTSPTPSAVSQLQGQRWVTECTNQWWKVWQRDN